MIAGREPSSYRARQNQRRPRATAGAVLQRHVATVQSRDLAHDAQPDAAALPAGIRPRERIETIKNPLARVIGHAGTTVIHRHDRPAIRDAGGERHRSAHRGEIDRVLQEISNRLPEEERDKHGPTTGYFMRHGTDHHSFVIFLRKLRMRLLPHYNKRC